MSEMPIRETWGDIYKYVEKRLAEGITDISDWRPASDMYIDDIAKIGAYHDEPFVYIPRAVRLWLENGDSIIYVKKEN